MPNPEFQAPVPRKELGIMSFQEYAEREHPVPYGYAIASKDKSIEYFGSDHIHNPAAPQLQGIRTGLEKSHADLLLVEGRPQINNFSQEKLADWLAQQSEESIIQEQGEGGLAMKLAAARGIKIESPEPSFNLEVEELEHLGFSREQIFAFYVGRDVVQYKRFLEKPELNEYLKPCLKEYQREFGWEGFDFSFEYFQEVGKGIWGDFNPANVDDSIVDPTIFPNSEEQSVTVTNEIARASNKYRDEYMVSRVEELLKTYNSIYIVYGATHAVMQEPALRKIMQEYEKA